MAQAVIILDPAGDIQAGDFRQLDVHDDQVRHFLACNLDRPRAIAALERAITEGIEQVAEQAHVQLVVLDNEHGFRMRHGHLSAHP